MKQRVFFLLGIAAAVFAMTACTSPVQSSDYTQERLNALIARADAVMADLKGSSNNGEDVSESDFWVTPDLWENLVNARRAAEDHGGNIEKAYNDLASALAAVDKAKKEGLGPHQRELTIEGLDNSFSGRIEIGLGLYGSNAINGTESPEIFGNGEVVGGTVTVPLYSKGKWTGDSSLYYVFIQRYTGEPRAYISNSQFRFDGKDYKQTAKFSEFSSFTFTYTFSEIAVPLGISIPRWGTTYGAILDGMEDGELPGLFKDALYKDKARNKQFDDDDPIRPDTLVYSEFNYLAGIGEWQIGAITGTITLTGISDVQQVSISFYSRDTPFRSRNRLIHISDDGTNLTWSIPIYNVDGFSYPVTGNFRLDVVSKDDDSTFFVDIPSPDPINKETFDVGDLGSIRLGSITLSGTINVTHDGQVVPFVEIVALYDTFFELGRTTLASPGSNAVWSMKAGQPVNSKITSVTFRVIGYPNDEMKWENNLFVKEITISQSVSGDNDIGGIVLNVN